MVGTQRAQLLVDRLDLGLEVVHQPQTGVDDRSPELQNANENARLRPETSISIDISPITTNPNQTHRRIYKKELISDANCQPLRRARR